MTFEKFKNNVENWSESRGIYEHSTALAQALKAVSEVGELADATIKDDKEALKDAVGDVAVCIVNVAVLTGVPLSSNVPSSKRRFQSARQAAAAAAMHVGMLARVSLWAEEDKESTAADRRITNEVIGDCFSALQEVAPFSGVSFLGCCEAAWNEIKYRKGRMTAGGAFVKE